MSATEELAELVASAIRRLPAPEIARLAGAEATQRLGRAEAEMVKLLQAAETLERHCERFIDGCPICGRSPTSRGEWMSLTTSKQSYRRSWYERTHYPQGSRNSLRYEKPEFPTEDCWTGQLLTLCFDCYEDLVAAIMEDADRYPSPRKVRIMGQSHVEKHRRDALDVYFAERRGVDGLVKIGKAVHAESRLARLGLNSILLEPGGEARERVLHMRFADLRLDARELPEDIPYDGRTEWFQRRGALAHYLEVAGEVERVPV